MSDLLRPGEPILDAARRRGIDAVYTARDRGGTMHDAGAEAADAALEVLVTFEGMVWLGEQLLRHYPPDVFDGSSGDPGARLAVAVRDVLAARAAEAVRNRTAAVESETP